MLSASTEEKLNAAIRTLLESVCRRLPKSGLSSELEDQECGSSEAGNSKEYADALQSEVGLRRPPENAGVEWLRAVPACGY